jgi:hypothetical protein
VELSAILAGRSIGQTPKGEAPTTAIMRAWLRGWHNANLYAK